MTARDPVVFLLDVDNTLLDNDRVAADLKRHLDASRRRRAAGALLGHLRRASGRARLRRLPRGAAALSRRVSARLRTCSTMSSFLVNYPFANRLYPELARRARALRGLGPDRHPLRRRRGLPAAQDRALGLFDAVDGRVLIYIHKERELDDVEQTLPGRPLRAGRRQAAHPDRGEEDRGDRASPRSSRARATTRAIRSARRVSAGRHHGRAHRRPARVRPRNAPRRGVAANPVKAR